MSVGIRGTRKAKNALIALAKTSHSSEKLTDRWPKQFLHHNFSKLTYASKSIRDSPHAFSPYNSLISLILCKGRPIAT